MYFIYITHKYVYLYDIIDWLYIFYAFTLLKRNIEERQGRRER